MRRLGGWFGELDETPHPCLAGGELDVGEEYESELGVVDDDAVGVHSCDFGSEELDVLDDLLLEVKSEGENGGKLLEDITRVGTVGALNGSIDKVVELVVVDAPVVGAVGREKNGVGDVRADLFGDGFRCAFLCSNDGLIDHVDAVSFILGVGAGGDGR